MFLLPATQSTLSLDLLLPQLEQSPSPVLEPVLELCVPVPGCPACQPEECGRAGLVESWSPAALATAYPQLPCQTGAAGSRDFITAWRKGTLMSERGGKQLILVLEGFSTSECSLVPKSLSFFFFLVIFHMQAFMHCMASLEHSTLFLPWFRVRLLQSFFFPSFKNLVDGCFPIQKLYQPACVNS